MNIASAMSSVASELDEVTEVADSIYAKEFAPYFAQQNELYARLKSLSHPITDAEIEDLLTKLPLELFEASEALSRIQLKMEVVKISAKEKEAEKLTECIDSGMSKAAAADAAKQGALEQKLILAVYESIVNKVTRQMTFSRELIMGAKKIWDARRRTDEANPISEVTIDDALPEYSPHKATQSYIK